MDCTYLTATLSFICEVRLYLTIQCGGGQYTQANGTQYREERSSLNIIGWYDLYLNVRGPMVSLR